MNARELFLSFGRIRSTFILPASLFLFAAWADAQSKIKFGHKGKERSYFLFAPRTLSDSPPLLMLLHGSGRDGNSLNKK